MGPETMVLIRKSLPEEVLELLVVVLAEELEEPEDGLHHGHLYGQLPVLLLLPAPLHLLSQLKGQCHEMDNFVEGLKNQISTFCLGADGF
jgi:hypothetical protein